ncbi:hypothetical protein HGI15_15875 [Modestobacter lapidis]|nr:hypothetical protein [Modestobacter lapidis]
MDTGPSAPPPADPSAPRRRSPAGPTDEGGEAACLLGLVCPACGRVAEQGPAAECPYCGAPATGD